MRQAGVLAACGIIALEKMRLRLHEDHANAKYLGQQLSEIPGISVDLDAIKINMVFWQTSIANFDSEEFVACMLAKGIKISGSSAGKSVGNYRFVTNNGVTHEGVDKVVAAIKEYISTLN